MCVSAAESAYDQLVGVSVLGGLIQELSMSV